MMGWYYENLVTKSLSKVEALTVQITDTDDSYKNMK